jgi:hypothetical protein
MPRRRRGARAAAADAETMRGFAMRILLHSPKDTAAGLIAFAVASAIVANALFLQVGHHPAPIFGSTAVMPVAALPAGPLPRPRPVEADASPFEPRLAEPKPSELPLEPRPAEPKPAERAADPLANLVKAATTPVAPANIARPPAPIPPSLRADAVSMAGSRRVAAVQRVLTEYGYGQLKPTGTIGSDTQAAIQKFERDHKIPVTGQMSDRLVRELTAMVGHPID